MCAIKISWVPTICGNIYESTTTNDRMRVRTVTTVSDRLAVWRTISLRSMEPIRCTLVTCAARHSRSRSGCDCTCVCTPEKNRTNVRFVRRHSHGVVSSHNISQHTMEFVSINVHTAHRHFPALRTSRCISKVTWTSGTTRVTSAGRDFSDQMRWRSICSVIMPILRLSTAIFVTRCSKVTCRSTWERTRWFDRTDVPFVGLFFLRDHNLWFINASTRERDPIDVRFAGKRSPTQVYWNCTSGNTLAKNRSNVPSAALDFHNFLTWKSTCSLFIIRISRTYARPAISFSRLSWTTKTTWLAARRNRDRPLAWKRL